MLLDTDEKVVDVIMARGQPGREDGALNERGKTGIFQIVRLQVPIASDNPGGIKSAGNGGNLL